MKVTKSPVEETHLLNSLQIKDHGPQQSNEHTDSLKNLKSRTADHGLRMADHILLSMTIRSLIKVRMIYTEDHGPQ